MEAMQTSGFLPMRGTKGPSFEKPYVRKFDHRGCIKNLDGAWSKKKKAEV